MKGNRYLVTMQFFLHAKDEEKVIESAKKIAERMRDSRNNDCEVISIQEENFGRNSYTEIYSPETI
jgi:DNA helicase TIP49 (TBP-interacting protein)